MVLDRRFGLCRKGSTTIHLLIIDFVFGNSRACSQVIVTDEATGAVWAEYFDTTYQGDVTFANSAFPSPLLTASALVCPVPALYACCAGVQVASFPPGSLVTVYWVLMPDEGPPAEDNSADHNA
jgi:hypothetical protein